jgi:hypothetical protein
MRRKALIGTYRARPETSLQTFFWFTRRTPTILLPLFYIMADIETHKSIAASMTSVLPQLPTRNRQFSSQENRNSVPDSLMATSKSTLRSRGYSSLSDQEPRASNSHPLFNSIDFSDDSDGQYTFQPTHSNAPSNYVTGNTLEFTPRCFLDADQYELPYLTRHH